MITVYFIRHGQAGSLLEYDRLSDLGRQQSTLLGTWLARRPVVFDQAWSGRLSRQQETAEGARTAYREAGVEFPPIVTNPCWDEFDLDSVYRGIGPQLARQDDEFRRQWEELERQSADATSRVHRTWAPCDTTVVRAWVDGEFEYDGESFANFVERVRGGRQLFEDHGSPRNVAVFTSGTPTAVWAALALELEGRKVMQLAGVVYNTSMTVLRIDGERIRLFQFNTVPHLNADLMTHR